MLLAIAVILPAGCLIWFMTQAVKNERLAIRQKLIDIYSNQLSFAASAVDNKLAAWIRNINNISLRETAANLFCVIEGETTQNGSSAGPFAAETSIIWDANGVLLYPIIEANEPSLPNGFYDAYAAEFARQDCNSAELLYKKLSESTTDDYLRRLAMTGLMRCSLKKGNISESIKWAHKIGGWDSSDNSKMTPASARLAGYARLFEFKQLLSQKSLSSGISVFELLDYPCNDYKYIPMPLTARIYYLHTILDMANQLESDKANKSRIAQISHQLEVLQKAEVILADPDTLTAVIKWPNGEIRRFGAGYGVFLKTGANQIFMVLSPEMVNSIFDRHIINGFFTGGIWRVIDEHKNVIAGERHTQEMLFLCSGSMPPHFPQWQLEVYLNGDTVFEKAAQSQVGIYIGAGAIVIVLMLASTFLAGGTVLKQAKLNKLKNDFIATITHELKTPLASMRILVDTLLDEKCQSRGQEIEYLQLISKENARLSRLIDNFLTFSRMERNKQAFNFAPANPAEIAKAAADAVQTKFNHNCKFTVTLDENLPPILADKDAVITVLVNLLDNAYKYSGENKEISLNAFAAGESVCFAVKDNGIGLTRRQIKKVFDKFYQVDSSLSRKVEGTGLGLSIVKFIVDAHKGKIDVESKLGKGSIFKITLAKNEHK